MELMHRAALGVYNAMDWKGNIAIVCGGGNNGGDGYALAEILYQMARKSPSSLYPTVSPPTAPITIKDVKL